MPPRYDLINRVITWGLDWWWRRKAVRECLNSHPGRVLDLGCGTADLAIQLARLAGDNVAVIGIDYSLPMLEIAKEKAKRLTEGERISFIYGDAAQLPFPHGYFDAVAISFAFRNLTYNNPLATCYLAEALRVLTPGGRFIIVESSQPKLKLIRRLFHWYLDYFVYPVGWLLSGHRGAYHYLAQSAAHFYAAEELREVLIRAGFREVAFRRLLFGVSAIHVAIK